MSFLRAKGHPQAHLYPLGELFNESGIAVRRENFSMANDLLNLQLAIGSVLSKRGHEQFGKRVRELMGEQPKVRHISEMTED